MNTWLIIDDDPEDQEIFEIALREVDTSIKLEKASNGLDALQKLALLERSALPGLIFLDLNMGQMDGRECIVELKKDEALKHIPVFIYSTSSDKRDINELTALGATRYIVKPSDLGDLIDILKDAAAFQQNLN